jgi:hypothetical protein
MCVNVPCTHAVMKVNYKQYQGRHQQQERHTYHAAPAGHSCGAHTAMAVCANTHQRNLGSLCAHMIQLNMFRWLRDDGYHTKQQQLQTYAGVLFQSTSTHDSCAMSMAAHLVDI